MDNIDADQTSTLEVNERLRAEDGRLCDGHSQEQKEVNSRLGHHDQVHGHPADHDQVQDRLGDHDQVQDHLDNQFHQEEMSEGSEVVT